MNSPNNPTGGVLTRGDLERIADLARAHDLWVISDESYEDVLYDGAEHVSIASLPGMYERTVPVCTFSKTYAATGVRVGYLAVRDERLRDRLQKLLFLTTSNVSSISQYGAIGALEGSQDIVDAYRSELQARRDLFYAGIRDAAGHVFSGEPPAGAFYAFLRIDPSWAPPAGASRRVAILGDGRAPHRPRPHRLRAWRGLRPHGRGVRAVLFCEGQGRVAGRAGGDEGALR